MSMPVTPVYALNDHHHHNDHGYDNDRSQTEILNAVHRDSADGLAAEAQSTASIIAAGERLAFSSNDSADKQFIAGQAATERNGLAALTATERTGTASVLATDRNGSNVSLAIERTAGVQMATTERIAGESRSIMQQHNAQALLSAKDILLSVQASSSDSKFESAKQFGSMSLENEKNKNSIERQASDNYANIQMEAQKNKDALALQLAECCCELKEAVISTASVTQLLIRDTESARVRDALTASTTENLILRLSAAK